MRYSPILFLIAECAWGQDVALDPMGNVWKLGRVDNALTCGGYKVPPGIYVPISCGDATIAKLDPSGTQIGPTVRLGGHGDSGARAIGVDSAGNAYIAGYTTAPDFPVTAGALQAKNAGPYTSSFDGFPQPGGDVFVVKLNPDGSVAYSTFLGGSGNDVPSSISVDSAGSVYVAGSTSSSDFPLTSSAFSKAASEGFVAKIDPSGTSLNFSTFFPAYIAALAIDPTGAAYLTGSTSGALPTTPASPQPGYAGGYAGAFAAKIDPGGTSLIYSTYLGGVENDYGSALAIDSQSAAWIGGYTESANFPGAAGSGSAFLIKLSPDGKTIQAGSRLPNLPDGYGEIASVEVDSQDNVYTSGAINQNLSGAAQPPGFQPTSNAQLSIPCETLGADFLIEQDSLGALIYASYMRQPGTLFVTAPGHLLLYTGAISTLDLTSTPAMNFSCPVNAASYQTSMAAGEIVSLFGYGLGPPAGVAGGPDSEGRYPTSLAGVQALFNGVPAPLLFVQAGQINTVVPKNMWDATIQIVYEGQSAPALAVSGQLANPGVFAVLNRDGTINSQSNPAQAGSILTIFATGMSVPDLPDGQIVPLSPLFPFDPQTTGDSVQFAGVPGEIVWEGAAPGLILGVTQIDVQLPASLNLSSPPTSLPMVVISSYSDDSPPVAVFVVP